MNIKKRSIISVLLVIAMMFALASLVACNKEEEVEEERTVNIKIVGANNDVLSELDVTIFDVPSLITVYAAIQEACRIEDITFEYDDDFELINQIGIYGSEEEAAATVPTIINADGESEEIDDGSMWYWDFKVNGAEKKGSSAKEVKLNSGDKVLVEWLKDMGE